MRWLREAATLLVSVSLVAVSAAGQGTQQAQTRTLAEEFYGNAKPYMDNPLPELKRELPPLGALKVDEDQSQLPTILSRAGKVLEAELPEVPDLTAHETVTQAQMNLLTLRGGRGGSIAGVLGNVTVGINSRSGYSPQYASQNPSDHREIADELHSELVSSLSWKDFDYLILVRRAKDGRPLLEESRSDPKNPNAGPQAGLHGIGFGYLWLLFLPGNRYQARYRSLGQQKMNGRHTYVVGFAQLPDQVMIPGEIAFGGKAYPLLYQGVAWIDEKTFQIVRLRVDLLAPLPSIQMVSLTSDLLFGEVRIPELNLPLWLPKQVELDWRQGNIFYGELHRYNKYRLFKATAKILPSN